MYVATGANARPGPGGATWTAPEGESLLLTSASSAFCRGCIYSIGVLSPDDAGISITARAGGFEAVPLLLQDGTPHTGMIMPSACQLFSARVTDGSSAIRFLLTVFSGTPNAYASFQRPGVHTPPPSEASHGWSGDGPLWHPDDAWSGVIRSADGETALVIPQLFVAAHLGTYLVSVCTPATSVPSGFMLTALLHPSRPLLLLPGHPQQGSVSAGEWQFYTLHLRTLHRLSLVVDARLLEIVQCRIRLVLPQLL